MSNKISNWFSTIKTNVSIGIDMLIGSDKKEPVINLQDNEQYRCQMAGISTAALGYWKQGDLIHPDYDTPALREVADLYAKYDALCQQANTPVVTAKQKKTQAKPKPTQAKKPVARKPKAGK